MEWSSLLVLICPLMMILMMMGGKGKHGGHGQDRGRNHDHASPTGQPQPDLKLREEMNQLKAQNEQMQRELKQLSQRI